MLYRQTQATQKIFQLRKRLRVIQGGTSAGKTIAILLYLIDKAQSVPDLTISVVSESLPHIKKGAEKDFLSIMKTHKYYKEANHNKTDHQYNFETGSMIEFFGVDQADKVRGPRRDILFMNECNNIPYMTFDQMEVRTKREVILDYNPVSSFWVHEQVIPHMEHDFIILTYKDNEALDPEIIKSIESRKHNENWWRVFGKGEVGVNEGQIFTNWQNIKSPPSDARLIRRGLDFGYTIDPSALIDIYKWNNAFILDEQLYRKGMSNKELAEFILKLPDPKTLVVADSAEPKSIDEIAGYGVNITPSVKGQGSVAYRIQLTQDQIIFVTERSHNLKKERDNYLWKLDRLGNPLNEPEGIFNHGMDAAMYAIVDSTGIKDKRYNLSRIG